MKEIFTAKSIEEAKHLAAEKFGVSEDQIVYRILEEPKKGLFGKIKREAQVEACMKNRQRLLRRRPRAASGFPARTGGSFFCRGDRH